MRKKFLYKPHVLVALLLFAATQFVNILQNTPVLAANTTNSGGSGGLVSTYSWLDHTTIQGADGTIWIMKPGDPTTYISTQTPVSGCQANSIVFQQRSLTTVNNNGAIGFQTTYTPAKVVDNGSLLDVPTNRVQATVTIYGSTPSTASNTNCQAQSYDVDVANSFNHNLQFYYQDSNTIARIGGSDLVPAVTYSRQGTSNVFIENTGSSCKDTMTLGSNNKFSYVAKSATQYDALNVSYTQDPSTLNTPHVKDYWWNAANTPDGTNCYKADPIGITVLTLPALALQAQNQAVAQQLTTANNNGNPKDPASACYDALSPFGWAVCGLINMADGLYSFFANFVQNTLFFSSNKYDTAGLRASTQAFITLANTLIILFALLMIGGQIFNFEIFSAYTVKKVLPRIVIGAIVIQLSWPIFTTFIQIINAIGTGIYWLLITPFGLAKYTEAGFVPLSTIFRLGAGGSSGGAGQLAGSLALVAAGVVGATALIATGAWISVIVAAIGVLISLFVAILTLVVREMLIIVLLAIAPLAVALWIFPGTQRYWDMWWKNFSRLMLMYPLIMMLIAGGTISAYVLANPGNAQSGVSLNRLAAIIAYFAPLFLIGATFKFAGTALGAVSGMTGKLGTRMKGFSGRVGESGKKSYKGWAAGKYQHDAKGLRGRTGNAWARAATGNVLPSRRRAAMTAAAGLAYAQEKNKETDTLVASALSGKNYEQQGDELVKLMRSSDRRVADAARRRAVQTGRIDKLEESLYEKQTDAQGNVTYTTNAQAMAGFRSLMNTDSDFSKSVAQQRSDLAINPADFVDKYDAARENQTYTARDQYLDALRANIGKKSAQDVVSLDDSFFSSTFAKANGLEGKDDPRAMIDQNVLQTIVQNPQYFGQLKTKGRAEVTRMAGSSATASQQPQGPLPPGASGGLSGSTGQSGLWTPNQGSGTGSSGQQPPTPPSGSSQPPATGP